MKRLLPILILLVFVASVSAEDYGLVDGLKSLIMEILKPILDMFQTSEDPIPVKAPVPKPPVRTPVKCASPYIGFANSCCLDENNDSVCDKYESVEDLCMDGVQNQNETEVDCGGQCSPCPTCSDRLLNQGEDDVDCGGPCKPCPPKPTCSDRKQNQGEEKMDCGGPCVPCPTCSDGIRNQGEFKVDCGGPCPKCPACFMNTDCGSTHEEYICLNGDVVSKKITRACLNPGLSTARCVERPKISMVDKCGKDETCDFRQAKCVPLV